MNISEIHTYFRSFNHIGETYSGIDRYTVLGFASTTELLESLKGKIALDLGSGNGSFAKQSYQVLENQATIISMNPRLISSEYRDLHTKMDRRFGFSSSDKAVQRYTATAVAADWTNLPFVYESIDLVFATGSFLFYSNTYSESILQSLISLVKKYTGELRFEVPYQDELVVRQAEQFARQLGCFASVLPSTSTTGTKLPYLFIRRGES